LQKTNFKQSFGSYKINPNALNNPHGLSKTIPEKRMISNNNALANSTKYCGYDDPEPESES
jgi:hypothetical protein